MNALHIIADVLVLLSAFLAGFAWSGSKFRPLLWECVWAMEAMLTFDSQVDCYKIKEQQGRQRALASRIRALLARKPKRRKAGR